MKIQTKACDTNKPLNISVSTVRGAVRLDVEGTFAATLSLADAVRLSRVLANVVAVAERLGG